jgi:hypothetical protein
MPSSVINSDDGVVSGTSGLKSSGGDDGVLVFQSKGTETARINTDKQIVAAAGTNSLPALTTTGDLNTGIYFPAADTIAFAEGGAEAMRIDSSGNVGIGTTSPDERLDVSGTGDIKLQIQTTSTGSGANVGLSLNASTEGSWTIQTGNAVSDGLRFYDVQAGSERARITSGGDFLVGTSTSSGRLAVRGAGTGANQALYIENSAPARLLSVREDGYTQWGVATNSPYNFGVSTSTKAMYMDSSGGFGFNSSIRAAKTNIESAPPAGWIADLDIVTFNYRLKNESGDYSDEYSDEIRWGVIAEDAETVCPDFCSYDSAGKLDGFHYDRLIPVLVKAIQELKAINDAQAQRIETLEAKVSALEANNGA